MPWQLTQMMEIGDKNSDGYIDFADFKASSRARAVQKCLLADIEAAGEESYAQETSTQ